MNLPVGLAELAEWVRSAAGPVPPWPDDLRLWLMLRVSPHISIIPQAQLDLTFVRDAMARIGIDFGDVADNRRLHGCLVAREGRAVIFLDEADPLEQQRLTLMHELAHYLHDYDKPRRQAAVKLGESILEVLDGKREPLPHERIAAVMRRTGIGSVVHLLHRDGDRRPASAREDFAERMADRLAYELLAPCEDVLPEGASFGFEELVNRLITRWYLPAVHAHKYAQFLTPPAPPKTIFRAKV